MSNVMAEGIFPCTVTGATYGEDRGAIVVRINAKITEGPNAGRMVTYEDTVNAKSALYIKRSCQAVGWKPAPHFRNLTDDVATWIKETGGVSSAEIRHVPIKKGKKYDAWVESGCEGDPPIWDKCNSIGRGPKPLAAPSATALADAEDAMRRAMAEEGDTTTDQPDSDIPF